jgi:hypothetical protein
MENGGIAPPSSTSALDGGGQLHAAADLPPGYSPQYPLDRRLAGPQSLCGRCGDGKQLFHCCSSFNAAVSVSEYIVSK